MRDLDALFGPWIIAFGLPFALVMAMRSSVETAEERMVVFTRFFAPFAIALPVMLWYAMSGTP